MYNDITGVILAGGKSSRMGENKALLKIGSLTIIEQTAALLKKLFPRVILITNDPAEYEFLGISMYADKYLDQGPLAGIHSALLNSPTDKNFIISCDIPFMSDRVIKTIIEYKTDRPVTLARADGFIQQLAGLYHKKVLNQAEEILSAENEHKKCRVLSLIELTGAEIIDASLIPDCREETFLNLNRPEDYKKALNIWEKHWEKEL